MSGVLRYRCQSSSEQYSDSAKTTDTARSLMPSQTGEELVARAHDGRLSIQRDDVVHSADEQELSSVRKKGDSLEVGTPHGRLSIQSGNSVPAARDATLSRKSPIFSQKDDSLEMASHNGRLSSPKGDSLPADPVATDLRKSPLPIQKGDSTGDESPKNGRFSAPTGSSVPQKDDFASEEVSNVNVITLITTITFNVKLVAMFCCRVLGEPAKKWPVYRKLFQSSEVENDTQAIAAALLYTVAHRDDGSMRNPPSVFLQRCKDFHQPVPPNAKVFAEAMSLVERYGQLTYQQLTQQLSAQRAQISQIQAWQPELHAAPTSQTPSRLQPIPSGIIKAKEVHILLKPGGGMTGEIAQRVRGQIAHDIRFGRCCVTLVPLKDGSYGVLVDKTEQKVRQYVFYSEQEWRQRSVGLQSCYELFDGGVPQGLALLKKAMKRHE